MLARRRHFLFPGPLLLLEVRLRWNHHAPLEGENRLTALVVGNSLHRDDTNIWLAAGQSFVEHPCLRVDSIAVKSWTEMLDVFKFEVGDGVAAHIGH